MTTRAEAIREYTTNVLRARMAYDPDAEAATREVYGHSRTVRAQAVADWHAGLETQKQIAERLGVSQATVARWVALAREGES